ncbi:MAG: nuclear transport factor 2 family protein [Candidatus Limnocylindrales bacterium]
MTSNSARDLYRRWLDELWSGDPGTAERLVSEDFVGHWPGRDTQGPAELAAMIAETRAMFSEITFTLDVGPIVEGDLVAARWTGVGTTPDGTMSFFGNDILRIDGDRFVEYWAASSSGS